MKAKIPLEDRAEIEELIARYAWALDTGDFDGYADCFTEDCWIEHQPQGRMHGRAGLKQLTEELWYSKPNHYLGRQHNMTQIMMSPENGDVRIRCFWSILQHNVETSLCGVYGLGTWDTLAHKCADGEWRFKSVGVDIWRGPGVPWVGDSRIRKTRARA